MALGSQRTVCYSEQWECSPPLSHPLASFRDTCEVCGGERRSLKHLQGAVLWARVQFTKCNAQKERERNLLALSARLEQIPEAKQLCNRTRVSSKGARHGGRNFRNPTAHHFSPCQLHSEYRGREPGGQWWHRVPLGRFPGRKLNRMSFLLTQEGSGRTAIFGTEWQVGGLGRGEVTGARAPSQEARVLQKPELKGPHFPHSCKPLWQLGEARAETNTVRATSASPPHPFLGTPTKT